MTYALLAVGGGRRIEQFGDVILNRPCAADTTHARNSQYNTDAIFELTDNTASRGVWRALTPRGERALREPWRISLPTSPPITLELRATPFGHVGIFPEQIDNWLWLTKTAAAMRQQLGTAPRFLNLFGYTGGSTLAVALGGGDVTHVDSAKGIMAWGRRNAALNEHRFPAGAAIRWIVDDARKFAQRERRRGNRYHGVILDPPSFGHGTRGERWQLARDLPQLLEDIAEILHAPPSPHCLLLTCHTTGIDANTLVAWLKTPEQIHAAAMTLTASDGSGILKCGWGVRWGKCVK